MKEGLREFLGSGIRFFTSATASVYIGLRSTVDPSSSFNINLLSSLPSSGTEALTIDSSGNMGRQALGGGGSVTSVALAAPASILSVSGSPVNTAGTLTLALATQAVNTVWAGPATGSTAAAPTFRSLVALDIPKTLDSSWITNFDAQVRTSRLDQFAVPTASVAFNSQRATGLADPTQAQDAATKNYVDALSQGLDVKASVRVASTANVTLATPGTAIDGVTLSNGDRVLLKNQTTASQNGIYVFNGSGSALTRSTDANTSAKVTSGLFTFVEEGTANSDSGWILTTDGTITLDTTSLAFVQFSGAGQIAAGSGLTKTGNTLDVVGTIDRITANPDSIDIASTYAGQSSITTLGTIATGTWQGTAIAVANGGTGATTAANARANLSTNGVSRTTFTNASLASGVLTINPGLGQQYGFLMLIDNNNQMILADNLTFTSATSWSADLTSFGTIAGNWQAIALA